MYLVFEGPDYTGKTTQIKMVKDYLEAAGHKVYSTRQPGGSLYGNKLRSLLLDRPEMEIGNLAEIFTFMADRAQNVEEVIEHLSQGAIVLSDRCGLSTEVYQAYAKNKTSILPLVKALNKVAMQGLTPDLTFLFSCDLETIQERMKSAGRVDRIEARGIDYHKRVHEGFKMLSQGYKPFVPVDASQPEAKVFRTITAYIDKIIGGIDDKRSENNNEKGTLPALGAG